MYRNERRCRQSVEIYNIIISFYLVRKIVKLKSEWWREKNIYQKKGSDNKYTRNERDQFDQFSSLETNKVNKE